MRNNLYSIGAVAALFFLSGIGAFLLFRLLESEAHVSGTGWSVGGAAAGFVIIYKLLEKTFLRIYRPILPGDQTLALIHLFTDGVKASLCRRVFSWIDDLDNGHKLPDPAARLEIFDGIRHNARQYVTCFVTPFGDLNKRLEESWGMEFTQNDVHRAMEILESDLPSDEKRNRLWEIADANQDRTMKLYADDLRNLGAL